MVGIWSTWVIVGIKGRANPQPTGHSQKIGYANLSARVIGSTPLGNGCSLIHFVVAALDEYTHERRCDTLAHRPAFERRVHRNARAVALGDNLTVPGHDERRRQSIGRGKCGVDGAGHLGVIEADASRCCGGRLDRWWVA